jgi:hypothetical protein
MKRLLLSTALLAAVLTAGHPAIADDRDDNDRGNDTQTIAVFGDWPYSQILLDNAPLLINSVNADPDVSRVIHVGDIHSGSQPCTSAGILPPIPASKPGWNDGIYFQFQQFKFPFVYTPGDNEWTDCHAADGAPGFEPLERLRALRGRFFARETSFGRQSIALTRQAGYPENARWSMGGITFVTLHVVGSNNGRGRTAEGDAEFAARNAADIAWMREGFAAAKAANHRALMIIQQGNIFPDFPPFPGGGPKEPSGYTEVREALEKEVAAFARPVVLVHGDSHFFRIDKPLGFRRGRGPLTAQLENFTRVETFGAPNHHWVQVFVSADDPNVFTFRPRIVEGNVQRRSP